MRAPWTPAAHLSPRWIRLVTFASNALTSTVTSEPRSASKRYSASPIEWSRIQAIASARHGTDRQAAQVAVARRRYRQLPVIVPRRNSCVMQDSGVGSHVLEVRRREVPPNRFTTCGSRLKPPPRQENTGVGNRVPHSPVRSARELPPAGRSPRQTPRRSRCQTRPPRQQWPVRNCYSQP